MSWVRLDDQFTRHPKVARLSDKAFRAHVDALCYCACFLTDGYIPANEVKARGKVLAELTLELWARYENGYVIHDYLDYNLSRVQWQELQRKRREAGSKGGSKTQAGRLAEPKAIYRADGEASA